MKLVFLIGFASMILVSYSQNSNEFRTYYEFSGGGFVNNDLDGKPSYQFSNFREVGVKYLRKIKNNLYFETGLDYQQADLLSHLNIIPNPIVIKEIFQMVTIPIFINYNFGKYFFVNGGLIYYVQSSANSLIATQTGIGYNIGIGGRYDFKKYFIYVIPNFKKHTNIRIIMDEDNQKLTKIGFQLGVGFKF